MQRTWCNHLSTVPVPPGWCECFLNAWDIHSEGDTTPFSTLPMPRSTSDREKVLTCKEDSCNNAFLAVSWKQVTPSLMIGFRMKANTQGCAHLSQVISAVSHGWNWWGFSARVASCITKVRTHPSWRIRGALGTFIPTDAALNIVHLDTACVVQGYFPKTSLFFGTKLQIRIIHQ